MLNAGATLGGTYQLERILGKGGMGEVWLANHLLLNQPRAIKVMLGEIASSPEARKRFIQGEARNALLLETHPNLVRTYELSLYEGMPYIVMEYIEPGASGPTLKELMRAKGKLSLTQTSYLLKQIAAGLEAAHHLNIIHRDIKPANVLLNRQNLPKLTDFGLTKDLSDNIDVTGSGGSMGTPAYISPEQARGQPSRASDIYSLGVMLYEMLTGRLPFLGNTTALLIQHASDAPPPLQKFEPSIPDSVGAVVLRTLAKNPNDRFVSVTELAAAFEQAVRNPFEPAAYTLSAPKPASSPDTNNNEDLGQFEEMARQFLGRAKPMQYNRHTPPEKLDVSPWPLVNSGGENSAKSPISTNKVSRQVSELLNQFNNAYTQADWDGATQAGEAILRLTDGNSSIRSTTAEAYQARGQILYEKGYYKWAANDFGRAIQLEPNRAEYRYWLARSYFGLRSPTADNSRRSYNQSLTEQAITECSYAIQLEPSRADYFYSRYVFYQAIENREAAIKDLQKAAELGYPSAKKELAELRGFWRRFLPI